MLAIYEEGTLDAIQEDPYRLLTFGMRWQEVDALAKSEFGVTEEDPRRLTDRRSQVGVGTLPTGRVLKVIVV